MIGKIKRLMWKFKKDQCTEIEINGCKQLVNNQKEVRQGYPELKINLKLIHCIRFVDALH